MATTSQALKIYELLNKKLKNEDDVRFQNEKDQLATKDDIARFETRIEQGFKDKLKWLIVPMIGFSSLIIALIKLT